ncbi:MAG: hypothetical protein ABIO49_05565 [Dokdonella sp.]
MGRLLVAGWMFSALPAMAGSLPATDDVGIVLRVATTTDPQFRIGTQAVLALEIKRYGPLPVGDFHISALETGYAPGALQSIELSPYGNESCGLFDLRDSTSPPVLAYLMEGHDLAVGSAATCRVRLRVTHTPPENIFTFIGSGQHTPSGSVPDPDLSNNTVVLSIGRGSSPRSLPTLSTWWEMLLGAALMAMAIARSRRASSRAQ